MATSQPEPLVKLYELSGPKPWSPVCWCTRFALNYKGIPFTVSKVSYPGIKPLTEKVLPNFEGRPTLPIIEILSSANAITLNDSTLIALLLNERFTPEKGFKHLEGVENKEEYFMKVYRGVKGVDLSLRKWILYDTYLNALDPTDGSREYFKETREAGFPKKCDLRDVTEVLGSGEENCVRLVREAWEPLRERMSGEDGTGAPTYIDFTDAAYFKYVEAANAEKARALLSLWGEDDNTFEKLLKKVEKYNKH